MESILRRLGTLCQRSDIENWAKLGAEPTISELNAWLTDYPDSPIVPIVRTRMHDVEAQQAERARRATAGLLVDSEGAAAFADRGRSRLEDEDFDGALDDFEEAIRRDPAIATELNDERANALEWRGRHHLESDRIDDAIDDFNQAKKLEPALEDELNAEIVSALMRRGRENLKFLQFDDALADFEQAIANDPSVAEELEVETIKAVTKVLTPKPS
jgi:tetratricopeptide (TPR) repeat protein